MAGVKAVGKTVAVIGSGISGLSSAYYIKRIAEEAHISIKVTVLEKDSAIGGKLRTESANGFTIECGPDSILASGAPAMDLFKELGLDGKLITQSTENRGTYILSGGTPMKLPEGMNGMLPTRLMPMLTTPLISVRGKLRAAMEPFVPRSKAEDESIAAFVQRRFGSEVYDVIAEPMCGVIYAVNPENASIRRTLPYLSRLEKEHRSILVHGLSARKGRGSGAAAPPVGERKCAIYPTVKSIDP